MRSEMDSLCWFMRNMMWRIFHIIKNYVALNAMQRHIFRCPFSARSGDDSIRHLSHQCARH